MHQASTFFLKVSVLVACAVVLMFCAFIIRALFTENVGGFWPMLFCALSAAIPFFIGSHNVLHLLHLIDQKNAFSLQSIKALEIIKYCGVVICALYGVSLPYIFLIAQNDDAPGLALLGILFFVAPLSVAVFAGVFQHLLSHALQVKSENELTV